jgi:methyltransferase
MVSELAFFCLVGVVALQRLFELRLSRRNEARLKARGGREYAPHQLRWMTLLHGGWLIAMPIEVLFADRVLTLGIAIPALCVFLCGQLLRYAAIRSLGDRWCVRIITLPGEAVVNTGVFSRLRHPNYLGVALEIAALPLVHGAWLTALVASILNALVLRARIRVEESALIKDANYREAFN